MSRWRVVLLASLIAAPLVFLTSVGMYFLWQRGWAFYTWWPMAACLGAAYLLGWYWQRQQRLLGPPVETPPRHWTERDQQAWKLVEARATGASKLDPAKLSELQFYVDTGKELAQELSRSYHPQAADPIGALTIPEILAVIELAAHDMAELVDRYLPGGHLLSVNNWRQARQAAEWYQTASNIYWLVSALFAPINTGLRYAAAQVGLSRPLQMLQQDLLVWFYTAYLHRLGTYLIDLNSGRLRIGARRYRALVQGQSADGQPPPEEAEPADQIRRVTLTLLGQVKAGKSSVVNALLGEQRALADVLPATQEIARYELQPSGIPTRLVLLDTVGYGHAGPKEDQLKATQEAAQQSDLLLLVLHARNPARRADAELLQALQHWKATYPDLKMPPILAVLTHIDLLSPALEWSPPYNWQQPQRPKEVQMHQALEAVREQLGGNLVGVVPICASPGKVYGVEEWLLPALVELLDEGHAVALLRCLRAEADAGKIRKVFYQLSAAGKQLVRALWQSSQQ